MLHAHNVIYYNKGVNKMLLHYFLLLTIRLQFQVLQSQGRGEPGQAPGSVTIELPIQTQKKTLQVECLSLIRKKQ